MLFDAKIKYFKITIVFWIPKFIWLFEFFSQENLSERLPMLNQQYVINGVFFSLRVYKI